MKSVFWFQMVFTLIFSCLLLGAFAACAAPTPSTMIGITGGCMVGCFNTIGLSPRVDKKSAILGKLAGYAVAVVIVWGFLLMNGGFTKPA
jgi:hypothetical protein